MDTRKEYHLENPRVLLQPLVIDDVDKLVGFAINEPDLWKYTLSKLTSKEKLRLYIEEAH